MADKIERVVQFNVITDIQDAVTKTKQLQEFLNKLGVPEKLQSSFSKAFTKIEDAGAKAGAALARGLKDNKDINAFNTASKQIGDTWTHLTELLNKIPKDKLKDFFSASVKQQINDINNSIKQTQTEIGAIAAKSIKAKNTKYQRAKAAVTTKLPGTVGAFESAMGSGDFAAAQAAITATSKLNKAGGFNAGQMRDLAAAMEYALKKAQNLAEVKQRLGIVDGQNAEIAKLYAQALAEGNAYIDAQTGELKQGAQALDNMTQEQLGAAKAQNEMNQEMENFKNKITYFFGAANAINLLKRAARSAFATIKDLDKVMTEAAVVTNFSVGDMWSQLPEYTRRANELGVSVHDAYESATLFYQQGLKTNEVMAVSNETLKMARIAGLGAEDATKRMTNALRGFNMEINEASAGRINDVYSALAAKAAANVDEISTAMTKVASLAKSAGMEFETTSAFLTQIIETTQESPETAGTALKTIVSRFGEVKKLASEGGLTGTDEEGEVINLNKISTALKEVAEIDMSGFFAGTEGLDSILMKLSEKWNTLSTVQQRYIATQAAGSRQQSRFIALMQDYARTQELVSIAENSAGASSEQFGKTLDSLDSKLNRLKNAYDTFTMGLMESDLVKGVVDILTGIINAINNITKGLNGWAGILPKILMLWSGFKVAKTVFNGLFNSIATQFKAGGEKAAGAFRQGFEQGIKKQQGGKGWAGLKGGLLGSLGLSKQKLQHQTFSQDQGLDVLYGQNGQGGLLGQGSQLDPSKITNALASANGSVEVFRDNLIAAGASVEDVDKALNQFIPATEGVSVNLQQMGMAASTTGMALTMLSAAIDPEQETTFGKAVSGAGTALMVMGSILPIVGMALQAFNVSLAAAFWPILAIVAGIALLAAGIVAFVDGLQADTRAVKDAQKAHEEAQKVYEEEKKKLDDLNSSLTSLKTAYDKLDSGDLVEGTEEYNDALQKINDTVTDLLVKIPELRKAFTYENGVWRLVDEEAYNKIMADQRDQVIKQAGIAYDRAVDESESWGNIIKDEKRVEGRLTLKEFAEVMEGGANIEAAFTKLGKDLSDENRLKIANALKGEDYKAITQAFWEAGVDIDEGTQNEELAGQALQALLRGEDYTTTKVATEEYRQAILSAYGGDIQKGFADLEFERGEQAEQIFKGLATKPEYKEGLAKFASGELTQEQYAQFEKQIKDGFGNLGTEWLLFFEKHRPEIQGLTKSQSAGYLSQSKEIQAEVDKLSADNRAIAADALNGINIGEDGMAAVQAFINKIEQSGKSTEAFNKTIDQLEKAAAKVGRKMSETDEQWKGFLDTQTKLSLGQELTTEEFENLKKSMPDVFRKFEDGFVETANGVQIWDQALNQALINTILGYNEGLTEQQQRMRDAHQALNLIANTDTQLLIQRALDVGIAYSEVAKLQKKYGDGTEQLGEALKNLITATENGTKGLETFIHEIDRLYNLDQIQITLQRERAKYQREYNALLADGTLDIQKVTTARELEISALQLQRQNLENELEIAKEELANIGSKHWKDENGIDYTYAEQQKYFTVDELGTIQMTDAYTNITNEDDKEAADKYREELQKAVDLVRKKEDEIYENTDDLKALQDERLEDIITLEDRLGNMLEKEWEQRIEDQEALNDAIQQSNQRIVDELRKSVDLEREIRENTKKEEEIAELENRLAYLQRDTTGANDLEIMKTQKELDAKRESYIDGIVDSALKEIETQNEEVMKVQTDQLEVLQSQYKMWQEGGKAKDIQDLKKALSKGDDTVIARLQAAEGFYQMTEAGQTNWSKHLEEEIKKGLSAEVITGKGDSDLAKNKTLSDLQTKLNETISKVDDIPSQVVKKIQESEAKKTEASAKEAISQIFGYDSWDKLMFDEQKGIFGDEKELQPSYLLERALSEDGYIYTLIKEGTKAENSRNAAKIAQEAALMAKTALEAEEERKAAAEEKERSIKREAILTDLQNLGITNVNDLPLEQLEQLLEKAQNYTPPKLSGLEKEYFWEERKIGDFNSNAGIYTGKSQKSLTPGKAFYQFSRGGGDYSEIDKIFKEQTGYKPIVYEFGPGDVVNFTLAKMLQENYKASELQNIGLSETDLKGKKTYKVSNEYLFLDWLAEQLQNYSTARYFGFASGGLADFTGPAWLDGTKSHPEIVLNPSDSQNFIALRDILRNFDPTQQNSLTGDTYFDIKIDADIGSDYDVDQLAARIKQQIYQDGQYRNARVISYLR